MDMAVADDVLNQHVIDPEICIRCNTCEATCPVGAVTHDDRNYVVDPAKCNHCLACIPPCPTGSIDNWRRVLKIRAYTVEEQLSWDVLPTEVPLEQRRGDSTTETTAPAAPVTPPTVQIEPGEAVFSSAAFNATLPPWSAAHAYANLYGPKDPTAATVVGNFRVTAVGREYDTHHIVLDFGALPFPVLEGQSIGIVPPGVDEQGRAHHARQYSIASPRNGERPGYNNLSLTVKRVL